MPPRASRSTPSRTADRQRGDDAEPLTEERLIEAALDIIRREGASRLTMRELASELGVSSMAAYHHVANKQALVSLIAEHLYASVEVPPPDLAWHERLRLLALARRRAFRPYSGLAEAAIGTDTEQVRRIENAELDILLGAGMTRAHAVLSARVLLDWTLGHSMTDSILRDPERRRPSSQWTNATRLLEEDEELRNLHADDFFEFGLGVILAGLRDALAQS